MTERDTGVEAAPRARETDAPGAALWLAVLCLALALLVGSAFQTYALWRDRGALQAARARQEPVLQQAQKVRAQVESIARRTVELARQGHPGAARIVEELARRGVTIAPGGAGAAGGASTTPSTPAR